MIQDYINSLQEEFKRNSDLEIASQQKAYMRGQFEYFGMKSPKRREVQKPFLDRNHLPSKNEAFEIIPKLWNLTERDYQMFCLDLLNKYLKKLEINDLKFIENLITHKSWWDSVDFLAYKVLGAYFKEFPQNIDKTIKEWMRSNNIWLQRSCLLFQLKYKDQLNKELLENLIVQLIGSKEFFINKAIGWVLREYSKTDAQWVIVITNKYDLSNLSRKEALRLIE